MADADGKNERPLLPPGGLEYSPRYSADGRWIVYTGERNGLADIYRMHPDGSGVERLTDDPALRRPGRPVARRPDVGVCVHTRRWHDRHLADGRRFESVQEPHEAPFRKFPAGMVARRRVDRVHIRSGCPPGHQPRPVGASAVHGDLTSSSRTARDCGGSRGRTASREALRGRRTAGRSCTTRPDEVGAYMAKGGVVANRARVDRPLERRAAHDLHGVARNEALAGLAVRRPHQLTSCAVETTRRDCESGTPICGSSRSFLESSVIRSWSPDGMHRRVSARGATRRHGTFCSRPRAATPDFEVRWSEPFGGVLQGWHAAPLQSVTGQRSRPAPDSSHVERGRYEHRDHER